MVASKGLEKARSNLNQVEGKIQFKPGSLGLTTLHPLRRMWCELQVKHLHSIPTHFLGRAVLSKKVIPVAYSGAGTWDLWVCSPVLQPLGPKQPLKFQVLSRPQAGNEANSSVSLQLCISTHLSQIECEAGRIQIHVA